MCLIFHFYWSYPQTSASYVYDFGSWWWCLTALNRLYLFHDLKHYPLFTWSILLLAAHFAPSSHFFIYIRCLFAVFSPCFCLLQVGPNICISVYWCSSKMLFHRRIFFLTETSEILALVQYRLTWPKTHSSIQVRAARFYLSILLYVIWEANIKTEIYQTIQYKVDEIFNCAQTTHKFILTIFSCNIMF